MVFFSNLLRCVPCSSNKRMKRSRTLLAQNPNSSRPRLSYKQGKVFHEDKSKKICSALCTSTSASGIGIMVKRIKIADPVTPQKVEACERLLQLIEKIKKIEHPNLVRYLEASYDLDAQYFEIITEQLPISLEENQVTDEWHTKIYIMQILEAVEYLDSVGFSNLNLKLNNILFDHYGNLKIRDYVGNQYIEFLMSHDDSFYEKDSSKLNTETDIKCFMNIIRNIGMYKVKFRNASSYNGLIFYLENIDKWNFARIRADKFFNDIDQDGMISSSYKGFAKTRTAMHNKPANPIFLTAEEPKNVFKGQEKKPLDLKNKLRENDNGNDSDVFLKNLQRVQALKKAKVVGWMNDNAASNEKGHFELNTDRERQDNVVDINALRDIQKQLEDCFGEESDPNNSDGHDKTQKIVLNTIPSEHDETPRTKRTPVVNKYPAQHKLLYERSEHESKREDSVFAEKDSEIIVQNLSDTSKSHIQRSTNRSKEKYQKHDSMVDKGRGLTYLKQNLHLEDENKIKGIQPQAGGNFKKKQNIQYHNVDSNQYKKLNTSKRTDLDLRTDRSMDPYFVTQVSNASPDRLVDLKNNSESQHDILNVLKMLNGQKSTRFGSNNNIASFCPSENTKVQGNPKSNEIKNNSTQYYLARRSNVQQGLSNGPPKKEPDSEFSGVKIREFYRDSWVSPETEKDRNTQIGGKLNFNL